jgi:hypothetical protein
MGNRLRSVAITFAADDRNPAARRDRFRNRGAQPAGTSRKDDNLSFHSTITPR